MFQKKLSLGKFSPNPHQGGAPKNFHCPPGDNSGGGGIPSIRNWDPDMAETRPMNQEDSQAPQPIVGITYKHVFCVLMFLYNHTYVEYFSKNIRIKVLICNLNMFMN
jgi:hypothetical protein